MSLTLDFLGAAGTVTGSRFLVRTPSARILVDCGLFQGWKPLRLRNREPFPVEPASLDAVLLTHAHLDHSGALPLLVAQGFDGPIHCTRSTRDLAWILLPDSGRLQQEEAEYANRHGFSKHHPALPLYTEADAERALERFAGHEFEVPVEVIPGITARFLPAGHILGAAIVELTIDGKRLVFTGDLGRSADPIMNAPAGVAEADWLVVESTYGNRTHPAVDPKARLGEIIRRVAAQGGVVIVPVFAIGRAQALLHMIHRLSAAGEIPSVPVFLDSPMAVDTTAVWQRHHAEHRLSAEQCAQMCHAARFVNAVEESKALSRRKGPMVILAGSGMATGGRVVHHLKAFASDSRNAIVFTGYQPGGTRGAAILGGATSVKIHGEMVRIRASVDVLEGMSAHVDGDEMLQWLGGFARPPQHTFVVHGEMDAADTLRRRIQDELHWPVTVPEHRQSVVLDAQD
jgi:metallo-beta-lactamase family protein